MHLLDSAGCGQVCPGRMRAQARGLGGGRGAERPCTALSQRLQLASWQAWSREWTEPYPCTRASRSFRTSSVPPGVLEGVPLSASRCCFLPSSDPGTLSLLSLAPSRYPSLRLGDCSSDPSSLTQQLNLTPKSWSATPLVQSLHPGQLRCCNKVCGPCRLSNSIYYSELQAGSLTPAHGSSR